MCSISFNLSQYQMTQKPSPHVTAPRRKEALPASGGKGTRDDHLLGTRMAMPKAAMFRFVPSISMGSPLADKVTKTSQSV